MSRRRRRPASEQSSADRWRRFRVLCSCTSPPVVVANYAVPAAGTTPLPPDFLGPDSPEEPLVLHEWGWVRGGQDQLIERVPRGTAPGPGQGLIRKKPKPWRCPRCGINVSLTVVQADAVARARLADGATFVDLRALARTLGA